MLYKKKKSKHWKVEREKLEKKQKSFDKFFGDKNEKDEK